MKPPHSEPVNLQSLNDGKNGGGWKLQRNTWLATAGNKIYMDLSTIQKSSYFNITASTSWLLFTHIYDTVKSHLPLTLLCGFLHTIIPPSQQKQPPTALHPRWILGQISVLFTSSRVNCHNRRSRQQSTYLPATLILPTHVTPDKISNYISFEKGGGVKEQSADSTSLQSLAAIFTTSRSHFSVALKLNDQSRWKKMPFYSQHGRTCLPN